MRPWRLAQRTERRGLARHPEQARPCPIRPDQPAVGPNGNDKNWRLRADDLVVIYEAGTAEVGDLLAIWRRCVATGAKLLLLGDRGNCPRSGRAVLSTRMGQGVDHGRRGEDQDVVLAWRNLHPVAITDPEPPLGDLGNLGPVTFDRVLVIHDVPLGVQVGTVFELRYPSLAEAVAVVEGLAG